MVVDTSGNVGIGTITPAAKLDVVGGINTSGNLAVAGAVSAVQGMFTASNSSQAVSIEQAGTGFALTAFGGNSSIAVFGTTGNNTSGIGVEGSVSGTISAPAFPVGVVGYNTVLNGVGLLGQVTDSSGIAGVFNNTAAGGKILSGRANGLEVFSVENSGGVRAKSFASGLNVVTFSSTPTFDAEQGNVQKITLTGDVASSTLSNAVAGQHLDFVICQDGTGSHGFVWPTNVKGGMTVGGTASTCSVQSFAYDGSNAYALSQGSSSL